MALRVSACVAAVTGVVGAAGPLAHAADARGAQEAARELADRIQAQTGGAAAAPDELPKTDPCSLLSPADVRRFYPKASSGQRERSVEKYGFVACRWPHPAGELVAHVSLGAKKGSSMEEARGMAIGFTDPLNRNAGSRIRYETIAGVGDEAVAVVEKIDPAAGLLSSPAYLYTQRGDRQLWIAASELGTGDRAAALKILTELGRLAAGRL